jgi:lipopolysaccharide/colanic/teichoic acid biosynthesis glycosyltransferase
MLSHMGPRAKQQAADCHAAKRVMDVSLSLFALVLFAPVHGLAAVWVRIEDGGPLLFTQERSGRNGHSFCIYKLRTMHAGKVTRLGRWLRATGLDETAQFFNVLRGDMSIVGPRPLTPQDLTRLGWDRLPQHPRFALNPGITGLGQIFGSRGARQVRALDALYGRKLSPWLDLQLIALSFAMNLVGKRRVRSWLTARRVLVSSRSRHARSLSAQPALRTGVAR